MSSMFAIYENMLILQKKSCLDLTEFHQGSLHLQQAHMSHAAHM